MDKINNKRVYLLPALVFSSLICISTIFCSDVKATNNLTSTTGTQLAYFIGYHSYQGGYYGYHRYRGSYWTSWRYIGYGCHRSCLIDKWSGTVIRCSKRC